MSTFFKGFSSFFSRHQFKIIGGATTCLGLGHYYNQRQQIECKQQIQSPNKFNFGIENYPHPDKVSYNGEDAFFAEANLLAVADGVGRWADQGINPKEYSQNLINNVEKTYKSNVFKYLTNPKLLLIRSAEATTSLGSSTLCLVTIDKERNILKSSYIGDSGYCIYRLHENGATLIHKSTEQEKDTQLPYSLGNKGYGDQPQEALEFEHEIQDKDIVVVGSDGLFDNLDSDQIKQMIPTYVINDNKEVDVKELASQLAKNAKFHSLRWLYDSPFAQKQRKNRVQHLPYMGGKLDDITVIVGQVSAKKQ